jgi:hypothetical protein
MKRSFKSPLSTAIAIAVGSIVLLGYFLKIPLLVDLRSIFLRWAAILAGTALIVGLGNMVRIHLKKSTSRTTGAVYSLVFLISFFASLALIGFFGPISTAASFAYNRIILPVESSLMAVLTVVLIMACIRIFMYRNDLFSVIFILTVILVLLGMVTLPFLDIPLLGGLRSWIIQVPAMAGGRGILLGVALGAIAAGLRILTGSDRPYEG